MPLTSAGIIFIVVLMLALLVIADARCFELFFIRIRHFYMKGSSKRSTNIKLVQVSDLHLKKVGYALRRLARRINKLQPDLVVFTGDSIDGADNVPLLDNFLGLLRPDIPKAAILGNWEYQSGVDLARLKETYARHKGQLLVNRTTRYSLRSKTLSVTGLDDFLQGNADFELATKGYEQTDYHIVLSHCPQYSDSISKQLKKDVPVNFILSGHTHGGQVSLFGYTHYTPRGSGRYVKGWYNDRTPPMFVSKGIGTVLLPVRFGARAEIAVFHLPG